MNEWMNALLHFKTHQNLTFCYLSTAPSLQTLLFNKNLSWFVLSAMPPPVSTPNTIHQSRLIVWLSGFYPLPIHFVLDKLLWISWFPRLCFCGRCRNLEIAIKISYLAYLSPTLCCIVTALHACFPCSSPSPWNVQVLLTLFPPALSLTPSNHSLCLAKVHTLLCWYVVQEITLPLYAVRSKCRPAKWIRILETFIVGLKIMFLSLYFLF